MRGRRRNRNRVTRPRTSTRRNVRLEHVVKAFSRLDRGKKIHMGVRTNCTGNAMGLNTSLLAPLPRSRFEDSSEKSQVRTSAFIGVVDSSKRHKRNNRNKTAKSSI
ncbi:hypothetical protein MRX96_014696 [Rhipicephalus microplus]